MRLFSLLTIGLLLPIAVFAGDECLRDQLVLDRQEVLHYKEPSHLSVRLPSIGANGKYFTYAALHWLTGPSDLSGAYFDHELPPPQTIGLPYNLYKIEISVGVPGTPDFWVFEEDYSKECSEAGRSFFPGQIVRLPALKIPPKSDGSSREGEPLRIKIWGHL